MIYLSNITSGQTIFIPRNDSLGSIHKGSYEQGFEDGFVSGKTQQKGLLSTVKFTENGEYERENGWSAVTVDVPQTGSTARLEEKTVIISADTTNVAPSSGYDGMSAVTINAEQYGQDNYDNGFDDGFDDGFASGSSEGYESGFTSGKAYQKALLVTTALTQNGSYQKEDGWSGVTVNVDTASTYNSGYTSGYSSGYTSGYTDGEASVDTGSTYQSGYTDGYDSGYTSGYTSGSTDGYNSGSTDGYNSGYTEGYESGYTSGNTDGYASGYTSGHTDGENTIIDTFTAMTATTNGVYGTSAHPLSSITVNVEQTGSTVDVETLRTFTATTNGTYTINPTQKTDVKDEYRYEDMGWDDPIPIYKVTVVYNFYPSTGRFNVIRLYDTTDSSKGYISCYIENGEWISDTSNWYGEGEVSGGYLEKTGYTEINYASLNMSWEQDSDFIYGYDMMSAVSLDVQSLGVFENLMYGYGAYYPVDSATNKSYRTVFPKYEKGDTLYFDITVYTIANASLIGDNSSNLQLKMQIGDGTDLRVASQNNLNGATLHSYWDVYSLSNTGTTARSAQRICGEVKSSFDGTCTLSLDNGGCFIQEYVTQHTGMGLYEITFNTDFVSGIVLNSLVYRGIRIGNKIKHYYMINPETNEIEDYWNNNTVAPTYDSNGNRVYGVLEPRQFRF